MHHFKFYRPTTSAVPGAVTLLLVFRDDGTIGALPAGDPDVILDRLRPLLPLLLENPGLVREIAGHRGAARDSAETYWRRHA